MRLELGGELGPEAAAADRLVGDDRTPGAPDRGHDRVDVERHQRARVDDLGFDPFGRETLGRRARLADHPRERDDRQITTGAQRVRMPQRQRLA